MYQRVKIICYSAILCHFLSAEAQRSTDFYSYFKKDLSLSCSKDELLEVNQGHFDKVKLSLVDNMASSAGVNGLYRPRSALARAMYEKQHNDRYLETLDQNEWYRVNKDRVSPELASKFVQLHPDEETKAFLSSSTEKSTWVWTQIWYLLAKAVLRHFWSITDINGWLGRGSMFVLSEAQTRQLLRPAGVEVGSGMLVDIGAGDGEVSKRFANIYPQNYATEISASMRKSLADKGFKILDIDTWWEHREFDCICMLNLLDRCSKPRSMLRQARDALAPGGVLLLALVLPFKPYVEVNPDHKPEEKLPIEGHLFEDQLSTFIKFMHEEAGFDLVSWTRVPYLCEGDFTQAYYWLDDSVYVFKPTNVK